MASILPFYKWHIGPTGLLVSAFAVLISYGVGLILYRIYFHPLAKFPGPLMNALSNLPYLFQDKIQGNLNKEMLAIHRRYGAIVRIAPEHLAIDGAIAWPDVFASRGGSHEFNKIPEAYGLARRIGILPTLKDDHRRQRRLLSHAFSTTALQEQEQYIQKYVDLLVKQLHKKASQKDVVDAVMWLNYTTFDIIGELVFAEPFGSLSNGKYHPWVEMSFAAIKHQSKFMFLRHFTILRPLLSLFVGRDTRQKRAKTYDIASDKVEKRLERHVDEARKDFMNYILRHNSAEKSMTREEIMTNSQTFILAGSETTSTALSGLLFLLGTHTQVYDRLSEEIRSCFDKEEDIGIRSTMGLPYLQACIEEILRLYPPVAVTPPRVSPGAVVGGRYIPRGTLITVFQWATYRSPKNFVSPDKFAPERWLSADHQHYDARYSSDVRSCLKPFSHGPRDCIGKNLAYAEMRLLLARFLWNFDFKLESGQHDWLRGQKVFIIWEKPPLLIRLSPARRTVIEHTENSRGREQ